jgi:O-methyltransferase
MESNFVSSFDGTGYAAKGETLGGRAAKLRGFPLPSNNPKRQYSHSLVIPFATYSPWLDDREFSGTYASISKHTFVDVYRCFELWGLVKRHRGLEGDLLEVGVWRGGTGCLIARAARDDRYPSTVYLCDTFQGVVKAGANDPDYKNGAHGNTSIEIVDQLIEKTAVRNVRILQGIFPDETGSSVSERRFKFVHIDVDVYESARGVFDWIWPRLVPGGMVVFDDFGFPSCEGVTRLAYEVSQGADRVFIHNLNGHAIVVKIA